jgi:hypothetical protein
MSTTKVRETHLTIMGGHRPQTIHDVPFQHAAHTDPEGNATMLLVNPEVAIRRPISVLDNDVADWVAPPFKLDVEPRA